MLGAKNVIVSLDPRKILYSRWLREPYAYRPERHLEPEGQIHFRNGVIARPAIHVHMDLEVCELARVCKRQGFPHRPFGTLAVTQNNMNVALTVGHSMTDRDENAEPERTGRDVDSGVQVTTRVRPVLLEQLGGVLTRVLLECYILCETGVTGAKNNNVPRLLGRVNFIQNWPGRQTASDMTLTFFKRYIKNSFHVANLRLVALFPYGVVGI